MISRHICSFLFVMLAIAPQARADDAADVSTAVNDLYSKLKSNDAPGFSAFVPSEGFTEFNPESGELKNLNMEFFRGAMDSGSKIDLHVSDLKVQILGQCAIVTGYRVGSITLPDGKRLESNQCLTMVWAKEPPGWKLHHVHLSNRPH